MSASDWNFNGSPVMGADVWVFTKYDEVVLIPMWDCNDQYSLEEGRFKCWIQAIPPAPPQVRASD
jgi:hypothetical protein